MRTADVFMNGVPAGNLIEVEKGSFYRFQYLQEYAGHPVSLTMPVMKGLAYSFTSFPTFFRGLLPEGIMLEGLLQQQKIDRDDYFSQIIAIGADMVGAVTVFERLPNE